MKNFYVLIRKHFGDLLDKSGFVFCNSLNVNEMKRAFAGVAESQEIVFKSETCKIKFFIDHMELIPLSIHFGPLIPLIEKRHADISGFIFETDWAFFPYILASINKGNYKYSLIQRNQQEDRYIEIEDQLVQYRKQIENHWEDIVNFYKNNSINHKHYDIFYKPAERIYNVAKNDDQVVNEPDPEFKKNTIKMQFIRTVYDQIPEDIKKWIFAYLRSKKKDPTIMEVLNYNILDVWFDPYIDYQKAPKWNDAIPNIIKYLEKKYEKNELIDMMAGTLANTERFIVPIEVLTVLYEYCKILPKNDRVFDTLCEATWKYKDLIEPETITPLLKRHGSALEIVDFGIRLLQSEDYEHRLIGDLIIYETPTEDKELIKRIIKAYDIALKFEKNRRKKTPNKEWVASFPVTKKYFQEKMKTTKNGGK